MLRLARCTGFFGSQVDAAPRGLDPSRFSFPEDLDSSWSGLNAWFQAVLEACAV